MTYKTVTNDSLVEIDGVNYFADTRVVPSDIAEKLIAKGAREVKPPKAEKTDTPKTDTPKNDAAKK